MEASSHIGLTSPPYRARANEPFSRLPNRLGRALENGDLTFDQFAILSMLTILCGARGIWSGHVSTLKKGMRYTRSSEWFRQALNGLRDEGWISFVTYNGCRSEISIRLESSALLVVGEP